jgi:hypothetical protein
MSRYTALLPIPCYYFTISLGRYKCRSDKNIKINLVPVGGVCVYPGSV